MKEHQAITISNKDWKNGTSGYKVIKVEVSVPTENLYAVCTPIKMQ